MVWYPLDCKTERIFTYSIMRENTKLILRKKEKNDCFAV